MSQIKKSLLMNRVQKVPYYRFLSAKYSIELLFFDPAGINWEKKKVTGLALRRGYWQRGIFPLPTAIYNRCYPEQPRLIQRLEEIVGFGKIFNQKTQFDKWKVYSALQKEPQVAEYLPRTYQYSAETLEELISKEKAVVLKPRRGFGGAAVYGVTKLSAGLVSLQANWQFSLPLIDSRLYLPLLIYLAPPRTFICQQKIEPLCKNDFSFDVRVVLQKNGKGIWQEGGCLSRLTKAGTFLTNDFIAIKKPSELVTPRLLQLMMEVSLKVAQVLETSFGSLGEIGVDFLLDSANRPWLLEVNGKPDKALFYQLDDSAILERIYLNPIAYLNHLINC